MREIVAASNRARVKHGDNCDEQRTTEYRTWAGMKQRCLNPSNRKYRYYGGRGISICPRWQSYENFLLDMGRKPSADLTLDRIDNDGNYEPGNCRWATIAQQAQNQRHRRRRDA